MAEEESVVRAKSDRAALDRLYDAYHPGVMRYCLQRLLDLTVAEDVSRVLPFAVSLFFWFCVFAFYQKKLSPELLSEQYVAIAIWRARQNFRF
jgi:hypothetical protein